MEGFRAVNQGMRIAIICCVVIIVGTIFSPLAARADALNLVVNGGFEQADITVVPVDFVGWTASGVTGKYFSVGPDRTGAGLYSAMIGTMGADTVLSQRQQLATAAGQQYLVSFWLKNTMGYSGDPFQVSFDGVTLMSWTTTGPFNWTQFSFVATADSTSSELTFSLHNDPSFYYLDDVSVSATGDPPVATVPEPASLDLLGCAFVAAAGLRRLR